MQFVDWMNVNVRRIVLFCFAVLLAQGIAGLAHAGEAANFDLVGPSLQVKVSRDGRSLPISSVPNLQASDRLWIHPDFPDHQSDRYLLIVAFLQGSTNPPPEKWFTQVETWTKGVREEGTLVTVPAEAQQALLFLAPETSGAFSTLRAVVRGKPGVFVRASQDLDQANLDRTRLDTYLEKIRETSPSDPLLLHERADLLSRSLAVKVDPQCFDKPFDEQPSCLTQDTSHLVLEDTHTQSFVATLTTGPSADLAGAISASPMAGAGYYSPYISTAMDLVRLLSGLHTAEFQYLPALALSHGEELDLRLSSPPSFQNPKSALVIGLPVVAKSQLPPLSAVDPKEIFCLQNTSLVLPVTGAPLVFSTNIAHDLVIHLQNKSGSPVDLPARADAARGGLTVDTSGLRPDEMDAELTGTLHGSWGFESYDGPSFHLRNARSTQWILPASDNDALIVGREDTLHVRSGCAPCVEQVFAEDTAGKELKVAWKAIKPDELEIQLPLKDEAAGTMKLVVKQFGLTKPDVVSLRTYSEAAHLDHFAIHAGDPRGVLTGTRLDEVDSFELNGLRFVPAELSRVEHEDSLALIAPNTAAALALTSDEKAVAHVALKDGRVLELQTTVETPRPKVTLVSKSVTVAAVSSPVHLGNQDELPQDARLTFLLKTDVPERFPHAEQIEVATVDGSSDTFLSVAKGNLILQDATSVLAILDPLKNFGPSAFGALQFRPVTDQDGKGDWQPLANLVRIPSFREVRCPEDPDKPCVLSGSDLFLLDSVASDPEFKNSVPVPTGYSGSTLSVPRPNGALLYVKLRDAPSISNTVALPVFPDEH